MLSSLILSQVNLLPFLLHKVNRDMQEKNKQIATTYVEAFSSERGYTGSPSSKAFKGYSVVRRKAWNIYVLYNIKIKKKFQAWVNNNIEFTTGGGEREREPCQKMTDKRENSGFKKYNLVLMAFIWQNGFHFHVFDPNIVGRICIYIYIYIYKKSMNCTITFLIWIFFIATWLNKKIWRTARVT